MKRTTALCSGHSNRLGISGSGILFFLLAGLSCFGNDESANIPLKAERIWSREDGTATLKVDETGIRVEHSGEKDWALDLCKPFPVRSGESYFLSGNIVDFRGSGRVGLTAALFGSDGKIIDWNFGQDWCYESDFREGDPYPLEDELVVPSGEGYRLKLRLVGHGPASLRLTEESLRKTGRVELEDRRIELPDDERARYDYPVASDQPLQYWRFRAGGTNRDALAPDDSVRFDDHGTLFVRGPMQRRSSLNPLSAVAARPGERFFVSLQVKLDSGKVSLEILPWKNGVVSGSRIGAGTFAPSILEEGDDWANIHVYLTVPEGIEGFMPVIHAEPGTSYRVGELSVSRPAKEEVSPPARKVQGFAGHRIEEIFDRGLVARRTKDGVYLSWRLLKTDEPDVGFNVYRHNGAGNETKLNEKPVTRTTDFLDENAPEDPDLRWSVRVSMEGRRIRSLPPFYQSEQVPCLETEYLSIPLHGETSFSRIAFADLDGDGKLDYLLKTPNANIDPYINYWKPGPGTYKLQAYRSDGTFLWEKDLGWSIEQGIWYSPCLVADLDGDRCAEVAVKTGPDDDPRNATGRVYRGPEYLSILDGKTGQERTRIDWPERAGLGYNLSNRHQLCLAYLDGQTPCLIVLRGTYSRMVAVAYQLRDDTLEELWRYDNRWHRELWGQGAHTTHAVDLDGDGRDEVILGSVVLDDDGSVLWKTGLGHPDHVYVGDLDPSRPGLEVLFGIESRQQKNGVCMVDAATGKILWGLDHPTLHVHGQGMCSDIDARFPGYENWAGERDNESDRWFRTVKGEVVELPEKWSRRDLAPKTVWWDADHQRELIYGGRPVDFPSFREVDQTKFQGSIRFVGDVIGDWREEVVTSHEGEIRIYTTAIPAEDRRPTFLQDPNYRASMHESSMGYPQVPVPTDDLSGINRSQFHK